MKLIERNINEIIALCKKHRVRELYLFGSVLGNSFKKDSDIDMLIQFDKVDILAYFDNFMDFKESLENLLGRKVDLVENQAIKNPIFRKIVDREKKLVYDRTSA